MELERRTLSAEKWLKDNAIKEVSFGISTFTFQIHELPSRLINEKNGRCIRVIIRMLQDLEGSLVIAHQYLKVRVDISTVELLPVGFIYRKERGAKMWIQFIIKKLADFCFKCGRLMYLIEQSSLEIFEMIVLNSGLEARRFKWWLHIERENGMPFAKHREKLEL